MTTVEKLEKAKKLLDKITDGHFDWVLSDIERLLDQAIKDIEKCTKTSKTP